MPLPALYRFGLVQKLIDRKSGRIDPFSGIAGELDNGYKIRRAAIDLNIPLITNARLASAFIQAFCTLSVDDICIKSWQEYK